MYGFAGGDPVNFADPFGLCPECEQDSQADGAKSCSNTDSQADGHKDCAETKQAPRAPSGEEQALVNVSWHADVAFAAVVGAGALRAIGQGAKAAYAAAAARVGSLASARGEQAMAFARGVSDGFGGGTAPQLPPATAPIQLQAAYLSGTTAGSAIYNWLTKGGPY